MSTHAIRIAASVVASVLSIFVSMPAGAAGQFPDWDGVWDTGLPPRDINHLAPLSPEWRQKANALDSIRAVNGDVDSSDKLCIPKGLPMSTNRPMEFYFTPKRVTIITNTMEIRRIWTDGRQHTPPDKLKDSFQGESIGHWEGNTLVTDTVGLNSTNEAFYGMVFKHMHIQERIHLTAPDKLVDELTIIDPVALSQPWVWSKTFTRNRKEVMLDYYCEIAFDRSVDHSTGKQWFDLSPPK